MLTQALVWLNALAGAVATVVLSPLASLPDWVFATLVAALTGVAMLLVFKHTSDQLAIRRAARTRLRLTCSHSHCSRTACRSVCGRKAAFWQLLVDY